MNCIVVLSLEKLAQLKSLLEKELITQADYDEKKAQILAGM